MSVSLQLSNVSKSFGEAKIIQNLNLNIQKNERHAIIGPNGAGKSTLFHLISGHYKLTSGKITLNGEKINNLEPHQINRKGLARSFQVTNIFPKMSVYENIRCPRSFNAPGPYGHESRKVGKTQEDPSAPKPALVHIYMLAFALPIDRACSNLSVRCVFLYIYIYIYILYIYIMKNGHH